MRTATKLVVASGGLALLLGAGAGVASAQPVDDVIVNSTCTYPQAIAALEAQDPKLAQQLQAEPAATGWLKSLIAASPDQRRVMVAQARAFPGVQPFIPVITAVANTCQNF
ncbi:hemophore-related protein, Rv0203/Rv1174c family [Mycolicibacterium rutilum]|uniref:Hemophore-related protein, Rv0203/Rv1174c family n=1 Tax=Mycolicibacterium rutilum TaxID=370526 RepID=A0A1H6M3V9_MYCRU|nr:hemophore-related protein [Mycolicibacterium rutilum]SEH92062.1 hemophore-related protein, Rv0203/Rv1174c family [Mycolicibacterium rutilum]